MMPSSSAYNAIKYYAWTTLRSIPPNASSAAFWIGPYIFSYVNLCFQIIKLVPENSAALGLKTQHVEWAEVYDYLHTNRIALLVDPDPNVRKVMKLLMSVPD